ncbi:YdeI/OmpD-associated family protein [Enterococcus sp. LJL128]
MTRSIVEKLQLDKYKNKLILGRPKPAYFSELSFEYENQASIPVDLIIAFVEDMASFKKCVQHVAEKQLLTEQGVLYVAYPKKGNKLYKTFVHRDEIFPTLKVNEADGYVEGTELKFNRMVRLDDTFTIVGIKYLPKSKNKPVKKSQSVQEYTELVPKVQEALSGNPKALQFFNELTPGYQRGWAQYIYSAKQRATQEKRLVEAIELLEKGFKSKNLYQQFLARDE